MQKSLDELRKELAKLEQYESIFARNLPKFEQDELNKHKKRLRSEIEALSNSFFN